MPCKAEYHPETFNRFFRVIDHHYPGLSAQLLEDFENYINSDRNIVPLYFGRDAPYTQPYAALNAQLSHIHIKLPPAVFRQDVAQYYRTCDRHYPDKDAALIYTQGMFEEEHYLLLAFFFPDAHGMARGNAIMKYLANLAQAWRDLH